MIDPIPLNPLLRQEFGVYAASWHNGNLGSNGTGDGGYYLGITSGGVIWGSGFFGRRILGWFDDVAFTLQSFRREWIPLRVQSRPILGGW